MAGGTSSLESGEPEFQVAPMIDVLLVLLIFFMSIITAQVEQLDKTITLAVAPDAQERKPDPSQRTVNVRWYKSEQKSALTYLGKEWDDREELVKVLTTEAEKLTPPGGGPSRLMVLLRADKDTPAKEVQAAMQVIAQVTSKVAFAVHNK